MSASGHVTTTAALTAIYESHGHLTAPLVVEESRPVEAPLHSRFDWDDSVAGERWRQVQAAQMIRSVRIVTVREDGPPIKVRGFVHIPGAPDEHEDSPAASYVPEPVVRASAEMTAVALAQMRRRWLELRRAYQDHEEFWAMIRQDADAA